MSYQTHIDRDIQWRSNKHEHPRSYQKLTPKLALIIATKRIVFTSASHPL